MITSKYNLNHELTVLVNIVIFLTISLWIYLGEDWSNNEIIQAAAIGEFTSLDGIEWRNGAETAADEVKFDDALWKRIFSYSYLSQDFVIFGEL